MVRSTELWVVLPALSRRRGHQRHVNGLTRRNGLVAPQVEGERITVRGFGGLSDYAWQARPAPGKGHPARTMRVVVQSGGPM